jgi:23S rRNA pseudouridine1911/1915/1917 synthase
MKNNNQEMKTKDNKKEYTYLFRVNRSSELLEFLLSKLNTSRNNVKSLLTNRQILVNGALVTQYNFMLAKDDEVKIAKRPIPREENQKQAKPKVKKFYTFNIIYEDEDFIAIDKPYGLLSVESDKEREETAFNYVFNYLQNKNKALRPYILHRIDKETSGVLVFAKNPKIHSMMKLRWNELVKTREYYALVEGSVEVKNDTITSYLHKNQNDLMYSSKDPSGEYAITNYKVVKQNANYSLLRVNIETGRKNQIRVHMQDIGHPIVGDDKYGHTKNPLKRLGLHASKLEFTHPITKEVIEISASCPNIFSGVFK